jgi:hypothetical protein
VTGKDRILTTLAGTLADRVPFVPNIWQWFYVNEFKGTLPDALRAYDHPVKVLRALGADIFSKFEGDVRTVTYRDCDYTLETDGDDLGRARVWAGFTWFEKQALRHERVVTPFGTLTHTWQYERETGAPFEKEHWWKTWDEYAAIRYMVEHTVTRPDLDALERGMDLIGDDGTVIFQLLETPLKKFHWLAGQENASYFVIDHREEMRELALLHEKNCLEYLEQVIDLPNVLVYEVADNVDTQFYPPRWFCEFCLPILKKQAEMIHARGKYLFLHACGKLKALAPLFVETGVDCLEGHAPPPLGDWRLDEARATSDQLIVCGGMDAPHQELRGAHASAELDAYVRDTFASMGDKRRFLFGSSCNTSPLTPYENLISFRDAAWRYGKLG